MYQISVREGAQAPNVVACPNDTGRRGSTGTIDHVGERGVSFVEGSPQG